MLSDDEALRIYMQAMAEMDGELPSLPDPEDFARKVLERQDFVPYRRRNESLSSGRPRRWYERPIFHYTVAASITLVFVFSGAFDRMFPEDGHRERPVTQAPSYSEQLMEKTTGWLDRLKPR